MGLHAWLPGIFDLLAYEEPRRAAVMKQFIKCFVRQRRGVWKCVRACSFESPVGRIEVVEGTIVVRGTRFMKYDLAAELDEEYERQAPDNG